MYLCLYQNREKIKEKNMVKIVMLKCCLKHKKIEKQKAKEKEKQDNLEKQLCTAIIKIWTKQREKCVVVLLNLDYFVVNIINNIINNKMIKLIYY